MTIVSEDRRMTQLQLPTEQGIIQIQVVRSKRQSLGLEVRRDGRVLARIPELVSDSELETFINGHREWIIRKYNTFSRQGVAGKVTGATAYEQLTAAQREQIRSRLSQCVRKYSAIMGVTVGRLTVRNQKTCWGSCSSKGNVSLNYQLYYLPEELLDYVVIHELAHRRYMNHSAQFWAEVSRYCPDYKQRKARLNEYLLV